MRKYIQWEHNHNNNNNITAATAAATKTVVTHEQLKKNVQRIKPKKRKRISHTHWPISICDLWLFFFLHHFACIHTMRIIKIKKKKLRPNKKKRIGHYLYFCLYFVSNLFFVVLCYFVLRITGNDPWNCVNHLCDNFLSLLMWFFLLFSYFSPSRSFFHRGWL